MKKNTPNSGEPAAKKPRMSAPTTPVYPPANPFYLQQFYQNVPYGAAQQTPFAGMPGQANPFMPQGNPMIQNLFANMSNAAAGAISMLQQPSLTNMPKSTATPSTPTRTQKPPAKPAASQQRSTRSSTAAARITGAKRAKEEEEDEDSKDEEEEEEEENNTKPNNNNAANARKEVEEVADNSNDDSGNDDAVQEKTGRRGRRGKGANSEKAKEKKRIFTKELRVMMFGFGDVANPLPETVDLMEDLMMEYIQEMATQALKLGSKRGKLQLEDLVFLIRKDKKKYARVEELLRMYEELKRARKAFEVDEQALEKM